MDFTFVFIILLGMIPFLLCLPQRTVNCPECGKRLPACVPAWRRTRRQWIDGLNFCESCQIQVDSTGKAVPFDAQPVRLRAVLKKMIRQILIPILTIVASYFVLFWAMDLIKQQAMGADVEPKTPATIMRHKAPQACFFDQGREKEVSARLVLHEHGRIYGADLYSFGVELENLSLGTEVWVEFDAENIKLDVTDEGGHVVPKGPTARSGPNIPVRQALIPPCGYTVFSTYDQGMGISGPKLFNAGYAAWNLKPGKYQISGSVLVHLKYSQRPAEERPVFSADEPKVELSIPVTSLVVSQ